MEIIDLRTCKKGDILITKHGLELVYVKKLPDDSPYEHEVACLNKKGKVLWTGTRIDDGHVFRYNRMEEDEDIIKIIHK